MKTTLLTLAFFMMATSAFSSTERRLFTIEKSLNSENILVINTFTNDKCQFVSGPNGPVDFYWLMDKKSKKEVHPMIRSNVQERVQFLKFQPNNDSFLIRLNDLSEIKHDLQSSNVEIKAEIIGGDCVVKSIITLGASAKYRKMNLEKTYCEVKTNLLKVPTGCHYLELQGREVDTDLPIKVRYKGN